MDYEGFKEGLLKKLRGLYGTSAEVGIYEVTKNNGQGYAGIQITMAGTGNPVAPVINMDSLYEAYSSGSMEMEECAVTVYRKREEYEATKDILRFAENAREWGNVKEHVFPILIATKGNEKMLKDLVSRPLLDMSVAYIVRKETGERGWVNIKISRSLLEYYGIDAEGLHKQAIENLAGDGYQFRGINQLIQEAVQGEETEPEDERGNKRKEMPVEMYVLTNGPRAYGAAGILDKKLVREFTGKRDFFILPSSLHEMIFVPVFDISDKKMFDCMVREVNETRVEVEERLADHCYYYDGKKDEIRMCA